MSSADAGSRNAQAGRQQAAAARLSLLPAAAGRLALGACLLLALPGCDEGENAPPPPPAPWTGLSQFANPPRKASAGGDSGLSPDELRVKQLEKLAQSQEKALKAQEEELKRQKKKEKEKREEKDERGGTRPVASGSGRLAEIGQDKGDRRKRAKLPAETARNLPPLVEIAGSGKARTRAGDTTVNLGGDASTKAIESGAILTEDRAPEPKRGFFDRLFGKDKTPPRPLQAGARGAELKVPALPGKKPPVTRPTGRITESMESVLSTVDAMPQRQAPASSARGPAERHDTVNRQIQQMMAVKRLEAREQAQEPAPAERNAEVVDLGGAAASGAPASTNPSRRDIPVPPQGAAPRAGAPVKPQDGGAENAAPNPEETKAALEEQYRAGLGSRDVVVREASYRYAAMQRRLDAAPYLLEELKQNNVLAAFAVQCLGDLGRLTEEVEAALLQGLASREAPVRQACAGALGRLRSLRAVQPLTELVKTEKNYLVRCTYVDALGAIGDPGAAPALKAKLAQRDEIEFVKGRAALSLARLGDPSGRAHLLRNLDSPLPAMQVLGLRGMAQLNEPSAAGYLNAGLESGYEEVWTTAISLFPCLGAGTALPVLRTRLDSPSEVLRRRAALAMGFLGSDEALPYIERAVRVGSLHERAMGCELLANLGRSDRVPLLIEKLQDPHTSVRQTAAVALTRLNAREALPVLLDAARGVKTLGDLPPALRGAGPDINERLVMLSCARILRGEKEDLVITTLPNMRENTWPEVDRVVNEQQVELVKMYQFVDVVADGGRALGVVLTGPDGKEIMYREGEHVASGFKVRELGLPLAPKDKPRTSAYVILMRGDDRIILAPGRPPDLDLKRK